MSKTNEDVLSYGTFYKKNNGANDVSVYGSFVTSAQQQSEETKVEPRKKAAKKTRKPVTKVRFSIGVKLISIISVILVVALAGVTAIVSYFVSKDTSINAEENNLTINSRTALDCENRINSALSATEAFSELLKSSIDSAETSEKTSLFFEHYPEIAGVYFPKTMRQHINRTFFASHELDDEIMQSFAQSEYECVEMSRLGNLMLKNASPVFQSPVLAIFNPINDAQELSVVVFYSTEALQESFSSGTINQSIFLNHDGEVLVHPDLNIMLQAKDLSEDPVFKKMSESTTDNAQSYFENKDGSEYIGAYKKINNTGSAIITTVQLNIILEGIRTTTRRNIYLTIAILSIAILIIWFFSRSLSIPIRMLADVANEINNANFNTELFDELESKHHDEIAVLTESTKNEREILNTITKLTNIGVVRSVIRKEVDFEPHLKDVTIFFSDIRGFTAISDGFNNRFGKASSAEIIGFLNDYMSRMVQCITTTGGTVDKFEGDAIMACWGVLRNDDLSFEEMSDAEPAKPMLATLHNSHKTQDALSAIKATIAMRYALRKYNKDAELFTKQNEGTPNAKYKPHIRIGCGLNSGRATVGFMGSWDKMEFTSIGDAVNLASRTESSNKPCGTDILITQDTYDLLKEDYIKCPENNFTINPAYKENEVIVEMIPVAFEVKGKGKQHFYGVVNMPKFNVESFFKKADSNFKVDSECLDVVGPNGPKTLREMRKLLGIEEPDFGGVNLDEAENKIQISAS